MKNWKWGYSDYAAFMLLGFLLMAALDARAFTSAACSDSAGPDCATTVDNLGTIDRTGSAATRTIDVNFDWTGHNAGTCRLDFQLRYNPLVWEDHTGAVVAANGNLEAALLYCFTNHWGFGSEPYPDRTSTLDCTILDLTDNGSAFIHSDSGYYDLSTVMTLKATAPTLPDQGFNLWSSNRYIWGGGSCNGQDSGTNQGGIEVEVIDTGCATDADADGVCDIAADNCTGLYNPGQRDDDGDGYGNLCDYDVDNNCTAGISDVVQIYGELGNVAPWSPAEQGEHDVNEDGAIGIPDVNEVYGSLGVNPGPSARGCADCTATTVVCP